MGAAGSGGCWDTADGTGWRSGDDDKDRLWPSMTAMTGCMLLTAQGQAGCGGSDSSTHCQFGCDLRIRHS